MTRENGEEPRRLADMEAQGRERFKKKECSVVSNAIEKLKKKKKYREVAIRFSKQRSVITW